MISTPLQYKIKVNIGDWSNDGHGYNEVYVFDSNYDVNALRVAYKQSCELVGVQFNHNTNYTDDESKSRHGTPYYICTKYGDASVSEEAATLLLEKGLDVADYSMQHDEILYDADCILNLILDFIKLSLQDLELNEGAFRKSDLINMDTLNSGDLNHQFGYGVFDD